MLEDMNKGFYNLVKRSLEGGPKSTDICRQRVRDGPIRYAVRKLAKMYHVDLASSDHTRFRVTNKSSIPDNHDDAVSTLITQLLQECTLNETK
jgi:hypothetical protein